MPTSILALQILLILLPGFAAAYVVQMFAIRGPQTDFDKVVESCLYSFLIYSIFALCNHGRLPFDLIPPKPPLTEVTIFWHRKALLLLVATTFIIALLAVLYINHDGNRLFRKLKLTERTSRRSVWNDIFQGEASTSQIVQIELDGNRSLIGVLTYYSDAAEDGSVFVEQASWIDQDGKTTPVPGLGVLLTKSANIKSISLLDPPAESPSEETALPEHLPDQSNGSV
jgi:hypothetical protein